MTPAQSAEAQRELRELRDATRTIIDRLHLLTTTLYEHHADDAGDRWLVAAADALGEAHDNLGTAADVDFSNE